MERSASASVSGCAFGPVATASASTRDGRRILEAVAEAVLWVVLFVEGAPWRAVVLFGSRFYSLKVDKRSWSHFHAQ